MRPSHHPYCRCNSFRTLYTVRPLHRMVSGHGPRRRIPPKNVHILCPKRPRDTSRIVAWRGRCDPCRSCPAPHRRAVAVPNGAVGLLSPPPPPSDLVAAASSSLLLHCSSCPRLSKECRPQIQFESFSDLTNEEKTQQKIRRFYK